MRTEGDYKVEKTGGAKSQRMKESDTERIVIVMLGLK